MLGGLPPPVSGAGLLTNRHVFPAASDRYASMKARCRTAVRMLSFESRADDGMIAKSAPSGSGPTNETKLQVLPPSRVRTQITRPSLPFDFAAVRNIVRSCLP